jgi:PAS domain S-box-containing protein
LDLTRVQKLRVGISRTTGLLVAALGATVLAGYILGVDALKQVVPGFASMKANTALCFLLAGLAAAQRSEGAATPARHRWGTALALGAGTIGAATVLEYVAGVDLGIDEALFRDSLAGLATSAPGRMSPLTAIDFTLLGFAFAVLDRRPARALATWVALPVAAVALFVLTSYLYGATFLATYTQMAVHTATGFLLLSVGLASARPNVGPAALLWDAGAIGSLARRLLPALVVVPLALGWGRSLLASRGAVGEVEGIALFALTMTFVLGVVGWLLLRRLQASDRERRAQEAERAAAAGRALEAQSRTDEAELVTGRGSWEWDITKDRAVWSRGMYRLFGLDPATFVNSNDNFLAMVHPDDRARMGQAIADALAKPGRFLQEYRLRRPDGASIHVRGEGNVRTDADGKVRLVFGFVQDVTEMKVLEERQREADVAVRRAQERFQRVFESSPVPIALTRDDGAFVDVNGAYAALVARSRTDLLGGVKAQEVWDDPAERQRLVATLRTSGLVRDLEVRVRRPDGEVRTVLASIEYVDVGGGTTLLSILQDITERKKAQDQREARIATEAEMERLRRTDRFRTEFINSTAHELRTPLTPLVLAVATLKGQLVDSDAARRQMAVLERATERLRHVVADMVEAADVQARTIALDRQRLNLTRELRAAVAGHAAAAHRANLTLEEPADSGLSVMADQARLQLILGHLLGNALKFTPALGRVTVSAERRGADVARIAVTDTGVGLTKAQLESLWQPFVQAHDKGQRTDSGSGLGLYVARGMVEAHGGEVGASSPGPGLGSTFWFTLPLAPGIVDPLRRKAEPAPPQAPSRNLNPGVVGET